MPTGKRIFERALGLCPGNPVDLFRTTLRSYVRPRALRLPAEQFRRCAKLRPSQQSGCCNARTQFASCRRLQNWALIQSHIVLDYRIGVVILVRSLAPLVH